MPDTPSRRAGLRNDIARTIHRYDCDHMLSGNDIPSEHHRGEADAVLAVLYREWPWLRAETEEAESAATEATEPEAVARDLTAALRERRHPIRQYPDERREAAERDMLAVFPPEADVEPELTAEEARDLADDLGNQLYRAQDALAFVEECCVIAERSGRTITVADVRTWLKGAQCGRQLAVEEPSLYDKITGMFDGPLPAAGDEPPSAALPCSHAHLRQPHDPHPWQPQPGMRHVQCPGWAHVPTAANNGEECPRTIPDNPPNSSDTPDNLHRLRTWLAAEHAKARAAEQHPRPDLDHLRVTAHGGIAAGLEIAMHGVDCMLSEHDSGPSVRGAAADDRRWDAEREGE
jgi:hypothetical protein